MCFNPLTLIIKQVSKSGFAAYPALGAHSAIWAWVQIPPQITVLTFFSDNCVSSSQPEAVLLWLVISNDCSELLLDYLGSFPSSAQWGPVHILMAVSNRKPVGHHFILACAIFRWQISGF